MPTPTLADPRGARPRSRTGRPTLAVRRLRSALAALALASGSSLPALAQEVVIVGFPGVSYPDLQPAVDAAPPGAVLLLAQGNYGPASVDGKGLTLVAAHGPGVLVEGALILRDLPADQQLNLVGVDVTGLEPNTPGGGGPGLVVLNCAGPVHVQDGTFRGGDGFGGLYPGQVGGPGVYVFGSPSVFLQRCTVRGGRGYDNDLTYDATGGRGGTALTVQGSGVGLHDCSVRGGRGGNGGIEGGAGGLGLWSDGAQVGLLDGVLVGGRGGDGLDFVYNCPGPGGTALRTASGDRVVLHGTVPTGGDAGSSFGNLCQGSVPAGLALEGNGVVMAFPDPGRRLSVTSLAQDRHQVLVTVTGVPGELVSLGTTQRPGFHLRRRGASWLGGPPLASQVVGVVPASGVLSLQVPTPAVEGGAGLHLQAELRAANGARRLTNPAAVVLLDADAPEDWDGNGRNDLVDVLLGGSADCQPNFHLDAQDIALAVALDCNGNGVPDSCDLASGTSADLDQDGVPDECQFAPSTWYVDLSAPAGGDGSVLAPFQHLNQVLAVVDHYDTVLLLPGTYSSNQDLGLAFSHAVTVRGTGGAAVTVLDGGGTLQGMTLQSPTGTSRLEGLTFRNCAAFRGAGVYCTTGATFVDCVFEGNTSSSTGAGVCLEFTDDVEFRGCRFEGNQAGSHGGGVATLHGGVRVLDCTFLDNHATSRGGAVHVTTTLPVQDSYLVRSRFLGNSGGSTSGAGGGALYAFGAAGGGIHDCLFLANSSNQGGAVQLDVSRSWSVLHCTFNGNQATVQGGAMDLQLGFQGPSAVLANNVFWGDSAPSGPELRLAGATPALIELRHCVLQGGVPALDSVAPGPTLGPGILDLDPLFLDPDGPDDDPSTLEDNDLSLAAGSPALDAGDDGAIPPDVLDVDGDGDLLEPNPLDLAGASREQDDPAPDTGVGTPPLSDLGAFER